MDSAQDFIVTVTARFVRTDDAPTDFEIAVADALMALADVATVRVEFAPQPSVCRLDATGDTPGAVEAACRATVERVIDELGARCEVESVVALTTTEWVELKHAHPYDMRNGQSE